VTQSPYGSLPPTPVVEIRADTPRQGLTTRQVPQALSSSRPHPMLSRPSIPKFGIPSQPRPSLRAPAVTLSPEPEQQQPGGGSATKLLLLPARDNPHRLFISAMPPSTAAASASQLTPTRPASRTPDRGGGLASGSADGAGAEQPHAAANGPAPLPVVSGGGGGGAPAADGSAPLPRLGVLARQGYSYEPGAAALEALHAQEPLALARVEHFCISREGVGSVSWLDPVDVRGLALDQIVSLLARRRLARRRLARRLLLLPLPLPLPLLPPPLLLLLLADALDLPCPALPCAVLPPGPASLACTGSSVGRS
jgi:nuclear pore complex protein Nup98-Nup96